MRPFGKVKKKTIPWRERSATQSFRTITMLTALIISEIFFISDCEFKIIFQNIEICDDLKLF